MATTASEVRRRREALKVNRSELARESGINRDTITDLEEGKARPHQATVEKVLEALDRLEQEVGVGAAPIMLGEPHEGVVEVAIPGLPGARVIFSGKGVELSELREQATAMILDLLREQALNPPSES